MPVKRRASKARRRKITPEAVEAYRQRDLWGLHKALGLPPWHVSPLPWPECPYGVHQGPTPITLRGRAMAATWEAAQALQREFEAAVCGGGDVNLRGRA
jgi:hypothetical protein